MPKRTPATARGGKCKAVSKQRAKQDEPSSAEQMHKRTPATEKVDRRRAVSKQTTTKDKPNSPTKMPKRTPATAKEDKREDVSKQKTLKDELISSKQMPKRTPVTARRGKRKAVSKQTTIPDELSSAQQMPKQTRATARAGKRKAVSKRTTKQDKSNMPELIKTASSSDDVLDETYILPAKKRKLEGDAQSNVCISNINATGRITKARAPEDFQTVLDRVWVDLLDYLEPDSVLTGLLQQPSSIQRRTLRDLKASCTTTEKVEAVLKLVKDSCQASYNVLKQSLRTSGQNTLADLLEAAEKNKDLSALRETLRTESRLSPEEKLLSVLKEELIAHYLVNESTMPVAPLAEQHDALLTSFYVRPPMVAYNKPNAYGQEKQPDKQTKTKINSYRALLFNNNEPYKKIYVTADAGMGKTSFSKMLARTWCQAQKQDLDQADKFNEEDVSAMREFDFVFLIHLRDYQNKKMCRLDDMILCVMKKLPGAYSYSKKLLEQVLCNKRCLTIVDGLDEWVHPMDCENTPRQEIPHTKCYRGCSVLTTTRPWKFSTARLSTNDVDQQVEISQLDTASSKKLETLAIKFLKENQAGQMTENVDHKSQYDFARTAMVERFSYIRYIPYILLQMVCLWFENKSIGKSLCEVYSNIIELTLTRWLVKTDSGHENCECAAANTDIKCMKNNIHCRRFMSLLRKISKLAFEALFSKIKEETLLFDKKVVLQCLCQEDLNLCLEIGILSQVKGTTSISLVHFKVLFPHKSIQEFLAALHIASNWDENTKETIFSMCTSLSSILELSNVFKFVCGMNPERYSFISRYFSDHISSDSEVVERREHKRYRIFKQFDWMMLEYQTMQVSCFQECKRNEHDQCQIVLDDIILLDESVLHDMAEIIPNNTQNMKTLFVGLFEENNSDTRHLLQILSRSELPSLKSFCVRGNIGQMFLTSIQTALSLKLKCLSLGGMSLTGENIRFVTSLDNLQHLFLTNLNCRTNEERYSIFPSGLLHKTAKDLLGWIQINTNLTTLQMQINCLDHGSDCSGLALDLSRHIKLENISTVRDLHADVSLLLTELHVSTDQLVECSISMEAFSADTVSSFLAELHEAPGLKTLALADIRHSADRVVIPCLRRLVKCTFENCNLGDSILSLSPELTSLELLVFEEMTMSVSSWKEVTNSISKLSQTMILMMHDIKLTAVQWSDVFTSICELPQHITVKLHHITVETDQWREVVTCISMLQLPVTVRLSYITTTTEQRAEVFSTTEKLTEPIVMELSGISVTDRQCTHAGFRWPVTVKLGCTRMTTHPWRENLMTRSINELPPPYTVFQESIISVEDHSWRDVARSIRGLSLFDTVRQKNITLTENQWREVYTSISKLPMLDSLWLSNITLTRNQWKEIFTRIIDPLQHITVNLSGITIKADNGEKLSPVSVHCSYPSL